MTQGVLLVAHGAPERVEDVESYLSYVRGGRPGLPHVVEEVRQRYAAIGGSSPLLAWTRQQARALAELLALPVFFGMRNWHPFIAETMEQVRRAGIERMAAICLTPQFSEVSVGLYMKTNRTSTAIGRHGYRNRVGHKLPPAAAADRGLGGTFGTAIAAAARPAKGSVHCPQLAGKGCGQR